MGDWINPPTPLFPMEQIKPNEADSYESVRRISEPIFRESLQEDFSNSMTLPTKILWRPNNYRRQITVKQKTPGTIKLILDYKLSPSALTSTINYDSQNKLISAHNFKGVTIQYGKNTLTAIYSQKIINGHKQVYLIEVEKLGDYKEWVAKKVLEIKTRIDQALFEFANLFKIKLPFEEPSWSRYEDWIRGESYIDKIPFECILHATYFKKVYPEGIEFKNTKKGEQPGANMVNYIENRAIESIAPKIAQSIIKASILQNPLRVLKDRCKSIQDIIENRDIVNLLSNKEKKEFGRWTFDTFGICA